MNNYYHVMSTANTKLLIKMRSYCLYRHFGFVDCSVHIKFLVLYNSGTQAVYYTLILVILSATSTLNTINFFRSKYSTKR
jgi:hypothetical protein